MHKAAQPLTALARDVLRGIRSAMDDECVYRGSDADAAALAGVSERLARNALIELSRRRMITLDRREIAAGPSRA
ncbi:hypothetical protein [Sphingomonas sp. BE137]|uniref:hypothetical protein n=1 Tax=Sphingomonas sp. BE137 TaxID=2817844 RepID=UPI001AE5FCF1|nr:hypothetical protein [Sphingomonas sp. BE137]MDR6850348.1 hypothetical protein [Sphingomonas sp. BE137]